MIALLPLFVRSATPRATVEAFVRAMNAGDLKGMAHEVVGTRRTDLSNSAGTAKAQLTVGKATIGGDEATVEIDLRIGGGEDGALVSHDTVHFRRVQGEWRIVPVPLSNLQTPTLSMIASVTVEDAPPPLDPAATTSDSDLERLKQIALATLMDAEDHAHRLPALADFKTEVTPYLESAALLQARNAPEGTGYFLDPRLAGMLTTEIAHPAETAMIVFGKDGKATFPFEGKTLIGYADGHVAKVDRSTAYKARTIPLK